MNEDKLTRDVILKDGRRYSVAVELIKETGSCLVEVNLGVIPVTCRWVVEEWEDFAKLSLEQLTDQVQLAYDTMHDPEKLACLKSMHFTYDPPSVVMDREAEEAIHRVGIRYLRLRRLRALNAPPALLDKEIGLVTAALDDLKKLMLQDG